MIPLPRPPRYCPRCGRPLEGERNGRPACAAEDCHYTWYPDPKVAVGVVVEHAGGILLVRRNHEPRIDRWAFPSSFVDAGEVVEDAAIREVREEAGVDVRLDALIGVYSEHGNPVVFIAYAGAVIAGTPRPGDEAHEVRAFPPDALPDLAFEHDGAIVRAWRAIRAGRPAPGSAGQRRPGRRPADDERGTRS